MGKRGHRPDGGVAAPPYQFGVQNLHILLKAYMRDHKNTLGDHQGRRLLVTVAN